MSELLTTLAIAIGGPAFLWFVYYGLPWLIHHEPRKSDR